MHHIRTLVLFCLFVPTIAFGTTHTVTSSGFSFSPSIFTATVGDTVIFSLTNSHNAVEVSQSTWNNDGSTALPGGFAVGFGGGTIVLTQDGTRYYVCTPHAGIGMKARITVNPAPETFHITALAGPNGIITPSGNIAVLSGQPQSFTFTPDPGYRIDSVLVDDLLVPDSTAGYTFDFVMQDHTLRVTFAALPSPGIVHYFAGWNMISLPVHAADPRARSVFTTATSQAFAYKGQYVSQETLQVGLGYWIKLDSAIDMEHTGELVLSTAVDLRAGWNIVGSLNAPIASSSMATNPPGQLASQFFGYNGGYTPADSLAPGKGYWVKASQNCQLLLSTVGR